MPEMVEAAEAKGFEVIAITEHVRSTSAPWWADYVSAVRAVQGKTNTEVLLGMEVNAIGATGTVDATDDMWRDAEIVLGAVHGYYDDDTSEQNTGRLSVTGRRTEV